MAFLCLKALKTSNGAFFNNPLDWKEMFLPEASGRKEVLPEEQNQQCNKLRGRSAVGLFLLVLHLQKEQQEVLTPVCVGFGGVRQLRAPRVPEDPEPIPSRWDRGRASAPSAAPGHGGSAARTPKRARGGCQSLTPNSSCRFLTHGAVPGTVKQHGTPGRIPCPAESFVI